MIVKRAAIGHSKHRNSYGLVGIELDTKESKIYIKLAKEWSRKDFRNIAFEISELYEKHDWGDTFIDQNTGEHFIDSLKKKFGMPIRVINTQKNLKDPKEIHKIKTMDKIEMSSWFLEQKQNHKIKFPTYDKTIKTLEEQVGSYSEIISESGSVDNYAPGDTHDHLIKALLISCFSVRKLLDGDDGVVYCGPLISETQRDPEREFDEAFGLSSY